MEYAIAIPRPVEEKIDSWNLPDDMLQELGRRLAKELASEPTKYLRDIVAPVPALQYNCQIPDKQDPSRSHLFLFRIRYSQDETKLILWDCAYYPPH